MLCSIHCYRTSMSWIQVDSSSWLKFSGSIFSIIYIFCAHALCGRFNLARNSDQLGCFALADTCNQSKPVHTCFLPKSFSYSIPLISLHISCVSQIPNKRCILGPGSRQYNPQMLLKYSTRNSLPLKSSFESLTLAVQNQLLSQRYFSVETLLAFTVLLDPSAFAALKLQ